jgi:hypothetical protein
MSEGVHIGVSRGRLTRIPQRLVKPLNTNNPDNVYLFDQFRGFDDTAAEFFWDLCRFGDTRRYGNNRVFFVLNRIRHYYGFTCIGDFTRLSDDDILGFKGCGKTTLLAIRLYLRDYLDKHKPTWIGDDPTDYE